MQAWRRFTDLRLTRRGDIASRRDFLRSTAAAAFAGAALGWTDRVGLAAETLRRHGKRCVLLYMAGGPSQFETFDPKPASGSPGTIATAVPGIHLSENLPHLARSMGDLALIRSLTSKEGSHLRAQYLMHHGHLPMGGADLPNLGANIAERLDASGLADAASELPACVRVGSAGASGGGGLLGVEYDCLQVDNPEAPPRNAKPATDVARYRRRLALLGRLGGDFAATEGTDVVADHRQILSSASRMILSPAMKAFDVEAEPTSVQTAYGESRFAKGCLLARRLLEAGVTFVEVTLGGWDTHDDNHNRVKSLCQRFDRPAAQLLAELKERGLLDSTLVVWMGDFGRTPKLNAGAGRDHYPRAFSAWLAGAGVRGGQTIGATDERGGEVVERPVSPQDLFQSIYHALGIDPDHENTTGSGRPIKLVDQGSVIDQLFG